MAEARKVLVVSAHPADFCSRAGGTLIKHVQAGAMVRVIWLTHGETEESTFLLEQQPNLSAEEVRGIREKEAFACVGVIGAEGKMFGFGDNPLSMTAERMEMLAAEIADFRPDVILTHWKNEITYPTHWMTSQSVQQAARMVPGRWDIQFFEPNIGTAARVGFLPDYYVDISGVMEKKVEALRKLAAQPKLPRHYTTCNLWRGLESGCEYAEGFVRLVPIVRVQNLLTSEGKLAHP
jgi:4-oxalomesaconate hydratase